MRDEDEEGPSRQAPSVAPGDDPDFPGHTVAGYVLDGEIGRGGMGVVYAATHPLIGKRVAIKVLSQELASDRVTLERFLLEARAVNAIGHPNIVDTFDFGILPDGRQYLVMDLLVGETLRTRLRRGPLSIGEASIIVDEVASALAAAHGKGIIHRDLKPDNVFIVVQPGRAPQIKLLDFGLVKLTATSTDGVERTRSGAIVGTPNYMSPEQARARGHLDHRTDIYALGVVTFEMIAGHLPFIRDNALDTLIAHVQEEIPSLHETVDRVPIELAQMVELMMAKAPSDRPTLAAIRQVLKRMPRGEISMRVEYKSPKPIAPPQRTVSDRPRPGTPRPTLEIPPDLEQASSPSIPEPRARSSPSFVDDYRPDPDEDHTVVSVPPPPTGRASTRRATSQPIRTETPPMGTRARRESVPPRVERPPTQPAPTPFEEADDLNSAWQPSNTDATAVTPPPPRASTRAETTPPPPRASTRPGSSTPLPSILARASSVAEEPSESSEPETSTRPTAPVATGRPTAQLTSPSPTSTKHPERVAMEPLVAPPAEPSTASTEAPLDEPPEPPRPHLPTRRTAPRVSTSNIYRPTERVPSLAIPPPQIDTADEEPLHTWPKDEAPTLVTPPELAAMAREPAPRSSSDSDVITSAPRSRPTDPPPLATPSAPADAPAEAPVDAEDEEIEVAWTIEPADVPDDNTLARATSEPGEIAPTTQFDVPVERATAPSTSEPDEIATSTSATNIDVSLARATSEPGEIATSTSATNIDVSLARATSEPTKLDTPTITRPSTEPIAASTSEPTKLDLPTLARPTTEPGERGAASKADSPVAVARTASKPGSIVPTVVPANVPPVAARTTTATKPASASPKPPLKPIVPAPAKPPPRSVPAWALATNPTASDSSATTGSGSQRAGTDTTSTEISPTRPATTPPATSPARPATTPPVSSTRSVGRKSEPNASIAAASLGKRTPKPTPFVPARTVRDSIANLASIQTGPTRSDAAIPERPTLQDVAVPERPTIQDFAVPERPTVKDVEIPVADSMFDAETSIGSAEVETETEAPEPELTMEIDDPRPTAEISAVQVEGLLDGIPSGLPSQSDEANDAVPSPRSPKTRSSPNLAELWSSELERSTAKRAAVDGGDEGAMTPAETVVAVTSSEPVAESAPAAAGDGTTTITSRRATTNTNLAGEPTAKPEPAAAPTAAPPPSSAQDDDDEGSSLLGAFGFDIQVKIDLPFDDDLGPAILPPAVTPEPVVPEKSETTRRPSKRSRALTKPPLEDARDSKSMPAADKPSRRSSDKLTRPPVADEAVPASDSADKPDDKPVDRSGRTPSARAIEKAIDRQMAGRDEDGPSRLWLYVLIALALGGLGVLAYLKLG